MSNTTVVLIPGFGEYPETKTFVDLSKKLKEKSYEVEIIKWPYYPEDLSKYSMTQTINSSRKIISDLIKKGREVIIHTNSMGSIVGVLLASEFPAKKLSMTVPPYQAGTKDDLEGKYKEWKETGSREFTSSKYGLLKIPFSFIEDARKYNALEYIKKINCPVLFIAGKDDTSVPWKTSKELFDKASEPKEWHCINNMQHRFQYQPEILPKVNEIIINFYSK